MGHMEVPAPERVAEEVENLDLDVNTPNAEPSPAPKSQPELTTHRPEPQPELTTHRPEPQPELTTHRPEPQPGLTPVQNAEPVCRSQRVCRPVVRHRVNVV